MSSNERHVGPSLYSRAGKSGTQRLQALKMEGAVLGSESPRKVAPALPHMKPLHKSEISKEALDLLIVKELKDLECDTKKQKQRELSQDKQSTTSTFKAQGRDEQRVSTLSPPCGHYNISYAQVDKKLRVPQLHRCRSTPPTGDESLPPGYYNPKEVTSKLHSPVPMHLQLERDYPLPSSPHEKRFEVLPRTPAISTRYRRSPVPDLSKALPRTTFLIAPQQTPQYSPNKEMLMSDLGRSIPFEKISRRTSLFRRNSDEVEPYNVKYSQIVAKIQSPQLGKTLPKDRLPQLPLPTFMQSAFNRLALQNVNEQMIRMNCTRDSLLSPSLIYPKYT